MTAFAAFVGFAFFIFLCQTMFFSATVFLLDRPSSVYC